MLSEVPRQFKPLNSIRISIVQIPNDCLDPIRRVITDKNQFKIQFRTP